MRSSGSPQKLLKLHKRLALFVNINDRQHFEAVSSLSSRFFAISRLHEIVSTNFVPFPDCGKPSLRIFCHFPTAGNRLYEFFAISRLQEIVSTIFLPFPDCRKPSLRIFCHFSTAGNRQSYSIKYSQGTAERIRHATALLFIICRKA